MSTWDTFPRNCNPKHLSYSHKTKGYSENENKIAQTRQRIEEGCCYFGINSCNGYSKLYVRVYFSSAEAARKRQEAPQVLIYGVFGKAFAQNWRQSCAKQNS